MNSAERMPVLFIGHGNPMNAIEESPFTKAWREEAVKIPRPEGNPLCFRSLGDRWQHGYCHEVTTDYS